MKFAVTRQMSRLMRHPILAASALAMLVAPSQGQTIFAGKASYRMDLPKAKDGNPYRQVDAMPLVSDAFKGPVATNDWWSSLVWPTHSRHSLPMFAHPLAVKAETQGLGVGYNATAMVSHSYREGKLFQTGTSYKYPYRESMRVSIAGMQSETCVLDRYSDWSVTALWKNETDQLRATFAHGSPFVYFNREGNHQIQIDFTAVAINPHSQPINPIVYRLDDITAKHNEKPAEFFLKVNAGKNIGIGCKARLTYDFENDGQIDRVETFGMFPTDPIDDSWEIYSSDRQSLDPQLSRGTMRDFRGGSVQLEIWKCFGDGGLELRHDDSHVLLPISEGKFFLNDKSLSKNPSTGTAKLANGLTASSSAKVFYRDNHVLGVTVNGTHYGLFAPTGAAWLPEGAAMDQVTCDLDGKHYFSVAVLPDSKPTTIQWYQRFAFAFLKDTRVQYRYDMESALVETTFTATTEPMEGTMTETLFALYRHQHLNLTTPDRLSGFTYESPRGKMKVLSGQAFKTSIPFLGVLPALPNAAGSEKSLSRSLEKFYATVTAGKTAFEKNDTYWNGKEFGKFSEVIQIADQLGRTEIRDELLKLLKGRLEQWADANSDFFFYYDQHWNILVGYPDSYGSGDQFNDHHFHYSYFIKAAATIAQFDPGWVQPQNFGQFIDLLIRSCANYDRNDARFPWLRNFDPYAGHSWASGHAGFASGNNQESSSESMNFATSLVLYGEATGNSKIRDLGIFWHATEAEAINHYWFDIDNQVFPQGYGHPCVGMIWGDGGTYGTWWTANPEEIHGINFLPINGGSLYLGREPDYVKRNFDSMLQSNRHFHQAGFEGDAQRIDRWHDVLHQYLALCDPKEAIGRHDQWGRKQQSEFGESKLHTQQWLDSLKQFGHFDPSTPANHPTAVVLTKAGVKTYVIFNARPEAKTVRFADGFETTVPTGLHVRGSK
jgi:endoglucanase Acf2